MKVRESFLGIPASDCTLGPPRHGAAGEARMLAHVCTWRYHPCSRMQA